MILRLKYSADQRNESMTFQNMVNSFYGPTCIISIYRAAVLKMPIHTSAHQNKLGNYFGKLSLDEAVNDHKRMVRLYDTAAKRYEFEDRKEEVIRNLANDCIRK